MGCNLVFVPALVPPIWRHISVSTLKRDAVRCALRYAALIIKPWIAVGLRNIGIQKCLLRIDLRLGRRAGDQQVPDIVNVLGR